MDAIFACIVQPKVIEFNVSDQKLHRAQKDEELREELAAISRVAPEAASTDGGRHLSQPGGGCWLLETAPEGKGRGVPVPSTTVAGTADVSMAVVGSAVCVFDGCLINADSLAEAYAPVPEDEPSPDVPRLSGAALMCHMYAQVGVEMLGLLRGAFTFVLYESKTSRVLAARDGSGRCPLLQARTPRDSLVLSPSRQLLEAAGCRDVLEFLPGDYKYGWSATPRRYVPADSTNKHSRRSLDVGSPALHGIHHNAGSHHNTPNASRAGSRRTSMDHGHHGDAAGGANRSRRPSMDHGSQASAGSSAAAVSASPVLHPHPHRTYIVSVDDPRIIKASPARHARNGAAAAAAAAGSAPGSLAAEADAEDAGGRGAGRPAPGSSAPRFGSAASSSSSNATNERRRSVDQQGPWRGAAGGRTAANGHGLQGDQQHAVHGNGNGGAAPARSSGSNSAAAGAGAVREGRQSMEGRKQHSQLTQQLRKEKEQAQQEQQEQEQAAAAPAAPASPAAPAATAAAAKGGVGGSLRVDAPEWKPHWVASATGKSPPVAVVGGSS
ncbi:hypothetical protein GPECTOR_5g438 [Gonium pectorale]|uniref:Glutamine amidotransferase type-2 domain-containing protein n=1 Tax=Gonium pectorale TaxID=33097 RepID=A0A150GWV0_GONPE|nr:hypothetical protein GPECTOR_5g438 [Gonium pectorale]|eukprot:KXZ54357.1 hypothetical protein GPECTOR_5g438 [Gonium pectorale]